MDPVKRQTPTVATMDICLAGVFVGRGEPIPPDLYEAWQRRLVKMGLDEKLPSTPEPRL